MAERIRVTPLMVAIVTQPIVGHLPIQAGADFNKRAGRHHTI
jgi:hypothetical protein